MSEVDRARRARERGDGRTWRERALAAEAERDRLREEKKRAVYIAQHLWQMVPQSVWRDTGGDDMQGHYEGDYHAEQVRDELAALAGEDKSPAEDHDLEREPDDGFGPREDK